MYLVLIGALAVAAVYAPIPLFYAYLPGPVRDVEQLVNVEGATSYSSEGSLYLTTVSVDISVTLLEWIEAALDDTREIVPRQEVTGGRPFEELERQQRLEMQQSKQEAKEVALTALGYDPPTGRGAMVVDILANTPAEGTLEEGDVIVGIDGRPVQTTCDLTESIATLHPGDEVHLYIDRGGETSNIDVVTEENPQLPGTPFLGIIMKTKDYKYDPGVEVTFETGNIAGPSAGLMFTLALYDRLTPGDLTNGAEIAGTGTIRCDGEVGKIGGIRQKVAGAEAQGAEIFLAPAGNFADAASAADEIEVVRVGNFNDAIDSLDARER
jgi:PDZ domain-containing protein